MKKGQMEMMGLAIIVILISLGLLFAVKFLLSKDSSLPSPSQDFKTSELGANFLAAMLETKAPYEECFGITFATLYQDCGSNAPVIHCNDGRNSCEYAYDNTGDMLDNSIKAWGRKYLFTAQGGSQRIGEDMILINEVDEFVISSEGSLNDFAATCPNYKPKQQPLPSDEPMYLWLAICE